MITLAECYKERLVKSMAMSVKQSARYYSGRLPIFATS
jgi:hypothetical protein